MTHAHSKNPTAPSVGASPEKQAQRDVIEKHLGDHLRGPRSVYAVTSPDGAAGDPDTYHSIWTREEDANAEAKRKSKEAGGSYDVVPIELDNPDDCL